MHFSQNSKTWKVPKFSPILSPLDQLIKLIYDLVYTFCMPCHGGLEVVYNQSLNVVQYGSRDFEALYTI